MFLLNLNSWCDAGFKPWSMCDCGCGCVAGTPSPLQGSDEDCVVMFNSDNAEFNGEWRHGEDNYFDGYPFYSRNGYTLAYFDNLAFGPGYYIAEGADWMTSPSVLRFFDDWMSDQPPTPTHCGPWKYTDNGSIDEDMSVSFCALAPDLAAAAMEEATQPKHEEMYCWKCKELLIALALLVVVVVIVVVVAWRCRCRAEKEKEKIKIAIECEEDVEDDAELDEIEIEVEIELETGMITAADNTATR